MPKLAGVDFQGVVHLGRRGGLADVFTDDELTQLRRLASDGLRATAFAEFAPRDPKEPPPRPETLARRQLCKRILDEVPAR